jgi:beta-galactosidase/beta-glucuronidase
MDVLSEVENDLVVSVVDPSDSQPIQRGKQVQIPGFIWYSAYSGIWQTVWLERVPENYLESIKITPDIDNNCVTIECQIAHPSNDVTVKVRVFDQGNSIAEVEGHPENPLSITIEAPRLWSPESPHLYDLYITLKAGQTDIDHVQSYFGMRKFSIGRDQGGCFQFCLNNQPQFLYGPLDQGYWPDGLSTPPTDQAIEWEINFLKDAGFNMLRKHVKVEPARYYYHCDRAGLIVWQDMVSGGISPKQFWFTFVPLMKSLRDDRFYWRLGRGHPENRRQFAAEYRRIIDTLFNVVSIAIWGPFNEGWGQFDAAQFAQWTKSYDPTRLVDHASGWFDQGAGDFKSPHVYFKPLPKPDIDPERAWVLSEFGGYSLNLPGHTWNPDKDFGYKKFSTKSALTKAYIDLLEDQLIPWIKAGLSAAVYTQTTDVETEVNGFLTYDRKVPKMEMEAIRDTHHKLFKDSIKTN